ncbi:hypothetical protein [Emticicia soli]|uniref:Uncharacterized protein n=1 Tax=Emticicia soli TaxID=2027878 RepID=A0ABW5J6H6_9BACT
MNVKITIGVSPYILSAEDKSVIAEGQTAFISMHTSPLVTAHDLVCTESVFNAIKDTVGTINAPALIANSSAPTIPNRVNCYIENGSLKIKAA